MVVKWGIVKNKLSPNYMEMTGFNQRSENIYLRVSDSHGGLATRTSKKWKRDGYQGSIDDGYYKLFDYWNEYGSPTEEDIYVNYYAGDESRWRPKLKEYRKVINGENLSFQRLLPALYPLLDSLANGDYKLNVADMLPTTGDGDYFYHYKNLTKIMDDATIETPLYQGYSAMECAFPLYLMPTQPRQLTDMQQNDETTCQGQGMGITLRFSGFNNYLIDGHHKAKLAFEQRRVCPCINICRLESGVNNVKFHAFSSLSLKSNYYSSTISNDYFLDYPTTLDVARTYDYFNEYSATSLADQHACLQAIMVRGQSEEGLLRIIQGLFYSNNISEYLGLETKIRNDYPFPVIYRCYYGLLSNWIGKSNVHEVLWQFLVDNISNDNELNNFIAERMVDVGAI